MLHDPNDVPIHVIVDLDGTLANCAWRRIHAQMKDWDGFHGGILKDPPHHATLAILHALLAKGYYLVYVTGRPEKWRSQTRLWLLTHGLPTGDIRMRADKDFRSDVEVKRHHLQNMREEGMEFLCAFDDRQGVVDMWREEGIMCFQNQKGDY